VIEHRQRELRHFLLLDFEEQRAAIERLSRQGMSDSTIATATGLSAEMVRQVIGPRPPKP
jgi:DNA-directed RNA polymerase specialized sigma24 family protein